MMSKGLIIVLSVLCSTRVSDAAGCKISVNGDLGSPQPLVLSPGHNYGNEAFILPDDNQGTINFKENAKVVLDCPGGTLRSNGQSLGKPSATIECVGGAFKIVGSSTKQNFKTFTCSVLPAHNAVLTGKSCLGSNKGVEIRYKTSDGRVLPQIFLCFDSKEQTTLYTQYNLTSSIIGFQNSFPRPDDFIQGNFYNIGNHKVTSLYTRYVQRVNINKLLGLATNDYKYISKSDDFYLARGHLVAKADFVYGAHQQATFYYINVAPQWQNFNGKNWNDLEMATRNFAYKRNLDLIVYTGTHGVTTLPHEKTGDDVKLYLYADGKGGFGIPVPQVFWKVVYEPNTKAGVAFVGVNNPYRKNIAEDIICKDICDQISWNLSWDKDDISKGYSYCCEVDDLRKVVKNMPQLTISKLLK